MNDTIAEILDLAGTLMPRARALQKAARTARPHLADTIYWNPDTNHLLVSFWPEKIAADDVWQWASSFSNVWDCLDPDERVRAPEEEGFIKVAYDPWARAIGVHLGVIPGKVFGVIPNENPDAFKSMLLGGLLGAGGAYGAGALTDWARGNWDDPERRRRHRLAALGGVIGALPGAAIAGVNMLHGVSPSENAWMTAGNQQPISKAAAYLGEIRMLFEDLDLRIPLSWEVAIEKQAFQGSGALGYLPPVQTDAFGQVVWGDPRVSTRLSDAQKTALGTVVYGASNLPYLTSNMTPPTTSWLPRVAQPINMAKILTGYGAGRVSAGIGAGIVSSLFNLDPQTQDRLKTLGGFAGALEQVADIALQR